MPLTTTATLPRRQAGIASSAQTSFAGCDSIASVCDRDNLVYLPKPAQFSLTKGTGIAVLPFVFTIPKRTLTSEKRSTRARGRAEGYSRIFSLLYGSPSNGAGTGDNRGRETALFAQFWCNEGIASVSAGGLRMFAPVESKSAHFRPAQSYADHATRVRLGDVVWKTYYPWCRKPPSG